MTTEERKIAVAKLLSALLGTIEDAGDMGAPLGPMYMALNSKGLTLDDFNKLIDFLTRHKLIEVKYHCAYRVH